MRIRSKSSMCMAWGTSLSVAKPPASMRLHIAAAVAALALLLILLQSTAMLMLFDEKEEDFIEALLSQQINYSITVWPTNPASAFPNTPDMQLYRQAKDAAANPGAPNWVSRLPVGNHELHQNGREYHVAVRDDATARYFLVYDVDEHEKRQREIVLMTFTGAFFLALLALAVGYGLAGRLSGRLERLAGRVAAHDAGTLVEAGMEKELLSVAEALDQYRQHQADMLDRERTFAANLSHELRTPLTAIRTDAELLAALPDLPESVGRRANRVMESVDRINRLSSSLLLMAREAKSGEHEEIRLAPAIRAVWASLTGAMAKTSVLRIDLPEQATMDADITLFDLVIRNVLENALRYCPAGEIVCRLEGSCLQISDQGPGFSDEDLQHVFDRFYTGQRGLSGLGLALVKHACLACGWPVNAANTPTGGAVITIDLGNSLRPR